MNILYVTLSPIHFNTSATLRNRAIIQGLFELGHTIDVLTIQANDNKEYKDTTFDDSSIHSIHFLPISQTYTALKPTSANKSIKSIVFKWLKSLYYKLTIHDYTILVAKKAQLKHVRLSHYDLVISSSDPKSSHVVVKKLLKQGLTTHQWIQYWGDPLTLDITNQVIYPKVILKKIERLLISSANKVVYVSPFTFENQKTLFPSLAPRFMFSPIPYLKPKVYATESPKYIFGYFGDYHAHVRNITTFFTTASKLRHQSIVAGNSHQPLSLPYIDVLQRVPSNQLEQLEANCEVLVCVLNLKGSQLPGKLYHYAATDKPIVVVLDGENQQKMVEYLESFDRFILVNNQEEAIQKLMEYKPWHNQVYTPSHLLSAKVIAQNIIS